MTVLNLFQAVNRVGLVSTTSSSGIMVDSSPPVLGHVYDVIDDAQTKDADYTVSIWIVLVFGNNYYIYPFIHSVSLSQGAVHVHR